MRAKCDCGSGKTLIINNNPRGYSCHCFRCDRNDFQFKGEQSLAELARIKKLNEQAQSTRLVVKLPFDFTNDIPIKGRLWLYKGGATPSDWKQYNIGYSPSMDRVILPVYNSAGDLIWFQARALNKGQVPKYLQPSTSRESLVFYAGNTDDVVDRVVVTEDILSAIRVGHSIPTRSLLGTKITTAQAMILSKAKRVTTWLDSDKAGRTGAISIRRTLAMLTQVDNIVTDVDPKELSSSNIKEALCLTT